MNEFSHMSLSDLEEMQAQMVAAGPIQQDRDFFKSLCNEIAERQKHRTRKAACEPPNVLTANPPASPPANKPD